MTETITEPTALIELYMIRHAESQTNLDRAIIAGRNTLAELSHQGWVQAEHLGVQLKLDGLFPDEVYVSPAVRAQQTAETCLRAMNCNVTPVIDERLHEMSQGIWEGRLRSTVYGPSVVAQINQQGRDFRAPGMAAESTNMVNDRELAFIDDISEKPLIESRPKIVFAFGHGLSTRILIGTMLGWSQDEIRKTEIANATPSLLTFDGADWTPRYVGGQDSPVLAGVVA